MGAIHTVMPGLQAERGLKPLTRRPVRTVHSRQAERGKRRRTATVGELLTAIQPGNLPFLLLGECADGLPFLVELGNPDRGAILIGCDRGAGKTHQLQVLADSAVRMNAPSEFQVAVITFRPGEWQTWACSPHNKKYLQGIYAWYDPWVATLIQNLVDRAEARLDGMQNGPQILFILDDLNFLEELRFETQVNLHWLLEYGAQANIWVAGAINAGKAAQFRFWVEPFRTRIIGKIADEENARILSSRSESAAEVLEPGLFRTWTGHGWRAYRLPLLGDVLK